MRETVFRDTSCNSQKIVVSLSTPGTKPEETISLEIDIVYVYVYELALDYYFAEHKSPLCRARKIMDPHVQVIRRYPRERTNEKNEKRIARNIIVFILRKRTRVHKNRVISHRKLSLQQKMYK